jgi:AraC-like DNA-binding protein
MPSSAHFTIISSWVLLIARALDARGYDSKILFRQAGLDHARLSVAGARFAYAGVRRLWELAAETTGDPAFGLEVANFWHPTTLHSLGCAWMASESLEEAYQRTVRYAHFINTGMRDVLKIEQTSEGYGIIFDTDMLEFELPPISIEAGLAVIYNMSRVAYGTNFQVLGVSLQRDRPDCADRYIGYFDAPVAFSARQDALWASSEQVIERLITANPEMVRINDQVLIDYLARLDRQDVIMQVRSCLAERLPGGGIHEADIASSINLSQRSLQRRLKEKKVSFSSLLEDTRRELSRDYLSDPQHSVNEVAYLLGFSEPGNFSRAFKRWYGQTPSEYRDQRLAG